MGENVRIWLIIAASLVLVGFVVLGGVMTVLKWDFTTLSTVQYETNDYTLNEDYHNISIITNTADISFVSSENSNGSVVCYEQKNVKHSVAVKDGTLVIEVIDTRKWYEHIGVFFGTPKITVSIPQGEYGALSVKSDTGNVEIPEDFRFESIDISENTGDVTNCASASEGIKIKTSTGNIRVENLSANMLDLSVSTGDVTVSHVTCERDVKIHVTTGKAHLTDTRCKNLISDGSTGDISLKHVIATETFSIERSTGDVKFDGSDAAEIVVITDTGNITGTLLTDKVFHARSNTGRVRVPQTVTGGICQITTDTGDIRITVSHGEAAHFGG